MKISRKDNEFNLGIDYQRLMDSWSFFSRMNPEKSLDIRIDRLIFITKLLKFRYNLSDFQVHLSQQ